MKIQFVIRDSRANPPQYLYGFVDQCTNFEEPRSKMCLLKFEPGIEFVTVREFKPGEMKPYEET